MLNHHPLGNTGMQTAPMSLGTVKLGRNTDVKYPQAFSLPDDRSAARLLDHVRGLGVNLLDTAPAYGASESRLGALLAGQRQHWLLCTKVGETYIDGRSHYDFTPEHCRSSVLRSLHRLDTDYLDIVLIHSDGDDLDILQQQGTLAALQTMKAEGLIRAVGISHKTVAGGQLALQQGADVLMATLNPNYTDELALIREASEQGCGILIKKALASGHGEVTDLTWVAAQKGVHSIVIGSTSTAHLTANAAAIAAAAS